jgi:acetate---CoA ligase (ADP-forming)
LRGINAAAVALPRAGALNEAEGLAFLQGGGVVAAPFGVAATADEAARLAEEFAVPVAIKVLSRDLLHKSDIGGVKLNVRGADAARAAFNAIHADVTRKAPGADFEGVLVARMVKPVMECMAGARFDPVFGPIIAFGLGGTEVEWLKRIAIATAPAAPSRVEVLLKKLGILERLDGWRGGPKIDPAPLIDAICGVANLAAAAGPRLQSIEVNPLMVTADGVFAADAVVETA